VEEVKGAEGRCDRSFSDDATVLISVHGNLVHLTRARRGLSGRMNAQQLKVHYI
jgi:hypothetical protein